MLQHIIGLFRKEYKQHARQAVGVIAVCFGFCVVICVGGIYFDQAVPPEAYLLIALYCTFLYTWTMSSTVYVFEHEKKTFPFLHTLPVSPIAIAAGKIGWTLFASSVIFAACLHICVVFCLFSKELPFESLKMILVFFCPAIAEVFVWGIFWSTRCRNVAFASLAAIICPGLTSIVIFFLFSHVVFGDEVLLAILPVRLAVIAIVGVLAVWGAMRWFEFSIKDTRQVWIPRNFVFARYPQKVQSPFLALIHQHLRHVSLVYPAGIICFILFSLGYFLVQIDIRTNSTLLGIGITIFVAGGIVVFWGNIFGHDQNNNSYRFLGRIGIHEGLVWRSRMLPAVLLYLPVLLCALVVLFGSKGWNDDSLFNAQIIFTVWLTVLALGAFSSISCEKQMGGICLTMALSYLILIAWMMLFMTSFGSSPMWTTVPVAFAFLAASRLRAKYWLREITTRRSRFISFLPVLGVILAVCIALPFVRIYSVPNVSWQEINFYLADAPDSYQERLLQRYAEQRDFARTIFSGQILEEMSGDDPQYATYFALRLMPWEETRRERILRIQIVVALAKSGLIWDDRVLSLRKYHERLYCNKGFGNSSWDSVWENTLLRLRDLGDNAQ